MALQPPTARGRTGQRRATGGCVRSVTTLRPGNRRLTTRCPVRSGTHCRPRAMRSAPRPLILPGGAAVNHFSFDSLAKALTANATRRASLGFFAAGLLGLASITQDGTAKKRTKKRKHRKKKHKKQGQQPGGQAPGQEQCQMVGITCVPGQSPQCCEGLQCDQTVVNSVVGTFCCAPEGTSCTSFEHCCSGTCDSLVGGG